jgi:hypothetical protein
VEARGTHEPAIRHRAAAEKFPLPPLIEDALKTQVMLDRAGYSPGEIDAIVGTSNNPDLFWDADANDSDAPIAPGPNNQVGIVWIDLLLPHYGLHGTSEPSRIGKTASQWCVRLTSWDAQKLAGLVRPCTKVVFAE